MHLPLDDLCLHIQYLSLPLHEPILSEISEIIEYQANFSVTNTSEMSEAFLRRELTCDRLWMFSVLKVQM